MGDKTNSNWKPFVKFLVIGFFFIVCHLFSLYSASKLVDFIHLSFLYGPARVAGENLHFLDGKWGGMYPHMIVSNGDRFSGKHSLMNFIATSIIWIYILVFLLKAIDLVHKKVLLPPYERFLKNSTKKHHPGR